MTAGILDELAGPRGRNAYLAGAAGSGMRGLATFLLAEGWRVWGTDNRGFAPGDPLLRMGLRPLAEGAPAPPVSLAIRSAAVPDSDPGFASAVEQGADGIRYAEALGRISRFRPVLAVAGSHGKTTVTAWISFGLRLAGVEAGYLVGASVPQLGVSSAWGDSRLPLVVESCEYDRSFLELAPASVALLNVDAEHPDTYPGGLAEVTEAFAEFLDRVAPDGKVFAGPEAPDLRAATRASWEVAEALPQGWPVGLPGAHNRRNAAVVAQVLRALGVDEAHVRAAVAGFQGAERRLEAIGELDGAQLLSDYAHHPTEIAATLQATRELHPRRRLVVVFQPHQAVRFQAYRRNFGEALGAADAIFLMEVYRVRDPDEVQVSVRELLSQLPPLPDRPVEVLEGRPGARERLRAQVRPGDVVLFLGAGDIDAFAREIARESLSAAAL